MEASRIVKKDVDDQSGVEQAGYEGWRGELDQAGVFNPAAEDLKIRDPVGGVRMGLRRERRC